MLSSAHVTLKSDANRCLLNVCYCCILCIACAVAAPARCSWQGKVRSLVASGRAVNISIYEQRFMNSYVSNAIYCIKDFNVQNMLNSNQKLHCCQTYKRLLTHAIKLILRHRSNEVE